MNSWFWLGVSALSLLPRHAATPEFFDPPSFVVAGVTDTANRGGHGSDVILRSSETLAKSTSALGDSAKPGENPLETVRELQHRAELEPSERNLFDWGAELLAHRAFDPAIEVFTRARKQFPRSTRVLLGLAAAYYAKGSYDQAAQRFFEAADLNASDPTPYLLLAETQSSSIADSDGYLERMARFARLQPANARANYYYAVALWKQKAAAGDAQALLEKAIHLDPALAVARVELGILRASQHQFSEAIRDFEQAIAIDAELPEAHYRLAQVYLRTGETAKAQREFALHDRMEKAASARADEDRRKIQQFVIKMSRDQN